MRVMTFIMASSLTLLVVLQAQELSCDRDAACKVLSSTGSPDEEFDGSLSLVQLRSHLNRASTELNATREGANRRATSGTVDEVLHKTGVDQSDAAESSSGSNSSNQANLSVSNLYNFTFGGRTINLQKNSAFNPEHVKELAYFLWQNGAGTDQVANYYLALNMERARVEANNHSIVKSGLEAPSLLEVPDDSRVQELAYFLWENGAGKDELANYYTALNMERERLQKQREGALSDWGEGNKVPSEFEQRVLELAYFLWENGNSYDSRKNYYDAVNMEQQRLGEAAALVAEHAPENLTALHKITPREKRIQRIAYILWKKHGRKTDHSDDEANYYEALKLADSDKSVSEIEAEQQMTPFEKRVDALAYLFSLKNGNKTDPETNYYMALEAERNREKYGENGTSLEYLTPFDQRVRRLAYLLWKMDNTTGDTYLDALNIERAKQANATLPSRQPDPKRVQETAYWLYQNGYGSNKVANYKRALDIEKKRIEEAWNLTNTSMIQEDPDLYPLSNASELDSLLPSKKRVRATAKWLYENGGGSDKAANLLEAEEIEKYKLKQKVANTDAAWKASFPHWAKLSPFDQRVHELAYILAKKAEAAGNRTDDSSHYYRAMEMEKQLQKKLGKDAVLPPVASLEESDYKKAGYVEGQELRNSLSSNNATAAHMAWQRDRAHNILAAVEQARYEAWQKEQAQNAALKLAESGKDAKDLTPEEQRVLERAYFLWENGGSPDKVANYYEALKTERELLKGKRPSNLSNRTPVRPEVHGHALTMLIATVLIWFSYRHKDSLHAHWRLITGASSRSGVKGCHLDHNESCVVCRNMGAACSHY